MKYPKRSRGSLTLRMIFHLPLRQTEGFLRSLADLLIDGTGFRIHVGHLTVLGYPPCSNRSTIRWHPSLLMALMMHWASTSRLNQRVRGEP